MLCAQAFLHILIVHFNIGIIYLILLPHIIVSFDFQGAIEFSANVVKQMKINIQELYGVGFRRFEVANVIPFACTPLVTSQNNYMGCNYSIPGVAGLHNEFLKTAISSLQTSLQDTEFNLLDVNNAFSQVLNGMVVNQRKRDINYFL